MPNAPHVRHGEWRVLLLEDSTIDANLVTSHLEKLGVNLSITRVTSRDEFVTALKELKPTIVLADYSLPDFDGLSALDIVRAEDRDLPFIFVSGVVGEEFAINALRRGATDYVMKRGLNRLPSAVERAMAEAHERQELVRAEQALRLSEISSQLAVEAAGLGKWDFDPQTQQAVWDAHSRELLGIDEHAPQTLDSLLTNCHNEDRQRLLTMLGKAIHHDQQLALSEECRIKSGTQERWVCFSGRCYFVDQRCVRIIGVVADITERKYAESALKDLNQTLQLRIAHQSHEREHLWQLSQDLLAVIDNNGQLVEVNPAWRNTLGYDFADTLDKPLSSFAHDEDKQKLQQSIMRAGSEHLRPFEVRFFTQQRQERWISWSFAPGHNGIYAVGRDITEDKEAAARLAQAEEALRQAQKMEALGQLTGGVAHDFNNLLQIVIGNIESIQRKVPSDLQAIGRAAEYAMAGAKRAASLTQRLLAFSRRQPLNPQVLDVNRLVKGMMDLLKQTLGELIEVRTQLSSQLWNVEIDANQLEAALLNLAVNARDAMPNGGVLTVTTYNQDLSDPQLAAKVELAANEYAVVCVTDTGSGMAPEVLARAYEPFFTTKNVGHGTGLGLSQVYGFVNQSGGSMQIHSAVGHGTTVSLYLPRLHGAVAAVEERVTDDSEDVVANETVLVVEDDADVRNYTVQAVRSLGYAALEARDGPSALELLRKMPAGCIDLLFSDVVLPGGVDGHQLSVEALKLHPNLKVLFATGYAMDVVVHGGRIDAGIHLIAKPFGYRELASRLRAVLNSERSASSSA